MDRKREIQTIILEHQRQLQKLKEQQAKFGLHTPSYILVDIEEREAQLETLAIELAALPEEDKTISSKPLEETEQSKKGELQVDPATITALTTTAIGVLTPYLAKAGEAAAKKGGEEVYNLLKSRFSQDPAAQRDLEDLAQEPANLDNQAALRKQIKKQLQADPDFAAQLEKILDRTGPAKGGTVTINQQAGDNAKQIGQIFGDVNF